MKKLLFLLLGVAVMGQGCFRSTECDDCYNPPFPFGFTLLPSELLENQNGPNLIPEVYKMDTIKLYYIEGDQRHEVTFGYGTSYYLGKYLISNDISVISAGKNIKTFYLYLNQQDTDTIYFDCKLVNDGCCTNYFYDSLSYNGKKMFYHPNSHLQYAVKPQPVQIR